ncbi:hypothetical protein ACIBIZ_12730 [Nonomuraea spiralis]|uniref:hypothetical protein n=1 Tax=Nonomuraea spiralis TaxID=46182 RepID=UPI0037AA11D5
MIKTLLRAGAAVLASAAFAAIAVPAQAADASAVETAGTCDYSGCGGIVWNFGSSKYVTVANCWQAGSTTYYGEKPPCVTNGYQSSMRNAMWWLARGEATDDLPYYYDTDAFKVDAGCVMKYIKDGYNYTRDRRGLSSMWEKISDSTSVRVDSYTC